MQKIPLKTVLKAQKRLSSKESSSTKPCTSKAINEDDPVPSSKHRKGREAPRRAMAPELTKPRVGPAIRATEDRTSKGKGKGKVKAHREHKHACVKLRLPARGQAKPSDHYNCQP